MDPFQESDLYFSIFGYLDAAVDTQFVRVTPLRDSLFAGPEPIDAVITLEHTASTRKTVWKDSLFTFDGGRIAHNFWSAEVIRPGETYRLTAERSDGAVSTATVMLPDSFPDPVLNTGLYTGITIPPSQAITIGGVEELAELRIIYGLRYPGNPPAEVQRHEVSYLTRVRRSAGGLTLGFNAYGDLLQGLGTRDCPEVVSAEVLVAAAGPGWPDFARMDDETLALLGVAGNVDHGLGFLGGVIRKRIAWPEVLPALAMRRDACLRSPIRQ